MSSHKGVNGTMHIESDAVTFTREGMGARNTFGKDAPPRRIPFAEITGIVHKPAGKLSNGHLQLLRNGQEAPAAAPAKDPDGIQYLPQKSGEFEPLITWLRSVAEKNHPGGTTAGNAPGAATSTRVGGGDGGGAEPAWYQKRSTQLAAAALLGLLLGSCSGGDDNADELEQLRDQRAAAMDDADDAEQRAERASQSRDELQDRVSQLEERNEALQAQVAAAAEPEPEPEPEPAPIEEAPVVEPEPAAEPEPAPDEVNYANCSEVRAAGAAPIRRGEPGYRSGLDRDGDGIACDT